MSETDPYPWKREDALKEPMLREREKYIPLSECVNKGIYKIHSRNLEYGVYNAKQMGFIGIRTKFGNRFLDMEYHWDYGQGPYGTVKPLELIGHLPKSIAPVEYFPGLIDYVTGREVISKQTAPGEWHVHYFADNEPGTEQEECPEDSYCALVSNFRLFHYLDTKEWEKK